jgi:alpha-glucosidase (family GH31 glycosyl hydrolase)
MYTCLFTTTQDDENSSCFDPLFFHYPHIDEAFTDIEHTFIAQDSLKVSPCLEPDVTEYLSYFPNGEWVSMKNMTDVMVVNNATGDGEWVNLTAPSDTVNVHLMPGKVIVY